MQAPLPEILAHVRRDHFSPKRSHRIDTIILHATGGTNSLDWLCWQSSPPVSCHLLVSKEGVRHRIVPDKYEAWHAGKGLLQLAQGPQVNINARSLGLELENMNDGRDPYPVAQLNAAAYAVAHWIATYPAVRVYRHADVDGRKSDPSGLDFTAFMRNVHEHLCWMRSNRT